MDLRVEPRAGVVVGAGSLCDLEPAHALGLTIGRRTIVAAALAAPLALLAQTGAKVRRIGVLALDPLPPAGVPVREALIAGLRDLGYVEQRDYTFVRVDAGGKVEQLPAAAAELVASAPDLILTAGTLLTLAAKNATTTIPIVMVLVSDPVVGGLVASFARPGGNITGLGDFDTELNAKRVQLLREVVPSLNRLAVLCNSDFPVYQRDMAEIEIAARRLKLQLLRVELRRAQDLEAALEQIEKTRPDGAFVIVQTLLFPIAVRLFDSLARLRVPAVGGATYARQGALLSYGVSFTDQFRQAARYIDKIFKGAKPAELPVEQATQFDLIINLKTAKALGIAIPQPLLLRASEVIE